MTRTNMRPAGHLNDIHRAITLDQARDLLLDADLTGGILPARSRDVLLADIDQIIAVATRMGVHNTYGLAARRTELLCTLADLPDTKSFTRIHGPAVHETLHRARNLLALLLGAAELDTHTKDVPSALRHMPAPIHPRTIRRNRPCTADEIALMRLLAHAAARAAPDNIQASVYALVDAGATPRETTTVTPSHFTVDGEARYVIVGEHPTPGAKSPSMDHRFLDLDRFGRALLEPAVARQMEDHGDPNRTFTYRPTTNLPGSNQAASSAQRVLDRLMVAAGIVGRDVTASSIYLWRVQEVYDARGIDAAIEMSGLRNLGRLHSKLGIKAYATTGPTRRAVVVDDDFTVPNVA